MQGVWFMAKFDEFWNLAQDLLDEIADEAFYDVEE